MQFSIFTISASLPVIAAVVVWRYRRLDNVITILKTVKNEAEADCCFAVQERDATMMQRKTTVGHIKKQLLKPAEKQKAAIVN